MDGVRSYATNRAPGVTAGRPRLALALAALVLVATPATAPAYLLLGGGKTAANGVFWTAPGSSQVFPLTFGTIGGKVAAATPLPAAGVLTKIRLWVRANGQDGGSAKIRVFLNGAATSLNCTINVAGPCVVASSEAFADGDDIAVRVENLLTQGGNPTGIVFSYGLEAQ